MRCYTAGCVRNGLETRKPGSTRTWSYAKTQRPGGASPAPTRGDIRITRAGVLSALFCRSRLGFGLDGFGCGCGGYGFVPLEGAAQAFLEIDGRGVAEEVARGGDVGLRVADVAFAVRIVLGFHRMAGDLAE